MFRQEQASGGQPCVTPPYLVLHCEEFAWPRMSPRAPVRSYIKPYRAAPFHPSPATTRLKSPVARWLVFSLLHLSSHAIINDDTRPAVSWLAAL